MWASKYKKSGKRADLDGIFFRSAWEANYARYLNWCKQRMEIVSWSYESKTFEFEGIKKGTRFYTPDFEVQMPNSKVEFHEVKGWKHPKGETALKRMARYFPEVKIVLVDAVFYRDLSSKLGKIIPNWEF